MLRAFHPQVWFISSFYEQECSPERLIIFLIIRFWLVGLLTSKGFYFVSLNKKSLLNKVCLVGNNIIPLFSGSSCDAFALNIVKVN